MATKKDVLIILGRRRTEKHKEICENIKIEKQQYIDAHEKFLEKAKKKIKSIKISSFIVDGVKFTFNKEVRLTNTSSYGTDNIRNNLISNDHYGFTYFDVEYSKLEYAKKYAKLNLKENEELKKIDNIYTVIEEKILLYGVDKEILTLIEKF